MASVRTNTRNISCYVTQDSSNAVILSVVFASVALSDIYNSEFGSSPAHNFTPYISAVFQVRLYDCVKRQSNRLAGSIPRFIVILL